MQTKILLYVNLSVMKCGWLRLESWKGVFVRSRIVGPWDTKMRLANCVQNKQGSVFFWFGLLLAFSENKGGNKTFFKKSEIAPGEQAGGNNVEKQMGSKRR